MSAILHRTRLRTMHILFPSIHIPLSSINRSCSHGIHKSTHFFSTTPSHDASSTHVTEHESASPSAASIGCLDCHEMKPSTLISANNSFQPQSKITLKANAQVDDEGDIAFLLEIEAGIRERKDLSVNFSTFPHYISDELKSKLLGSAWSALKQAEYSAYGGSLVFASQSVLLRSYPGTEKYQEKLAEAIAVETGANLLLVDGRFISPLSEATGDEGDSRWILDVDDEDIHGVLSHASHAPLDSDFDDDEDSEDDDDDDEATFDDEDDEHLRQLQNLVAEHLPSKGKDKFANMASFGFSRKEEEAVKKYLRLVISSSHGDKKISGEGSSSAKVHILQPPPLSGIEDSNPWPSVAGSPPWFGIRAGDRVAYCQGKGEGKDWWSSQMQDGRSLWILKSIMDKSISGKQKEEDALKEFKGTNFFGQQGVVLGLSAVQPGMLQVAWDADVATVDGSDKIANKLVHVSDIKSLAVHSTASQADIRTKSLFRVIQRHAVHRPLVVFMANSPDWLLNVPTASRTAFISRVQTLISGLKGFPVLLIGGSTFLSDDTTNERMEDRSGPQDKFHVKIGPITAVVYSQERALLSSGVSNVFPHSIDVEPPKSDPELTEWNKLTQMARKELAISKNRELIQKVMKSHRLWCDAIPDITAPAMAVETAEELVGLARNFTLDPSVDHATVSGNRLLLTTESFEKAIKLIKSLQPAPERKKLSLKDRIKADQYESVLLPEVIPAEEVGVSFDDIGAMEEVKATLRELVMLPLQRPELFTRGSLSKPVKGVLLFGPPGTGKTLLAKAIATEAGANFINISSSVIASKWYGDVERKTKALFTLARKLAPSVIFIDEVDSLLGSRGSSTEHEASRKVKNEFMASWDGLKSKDSDRVLVLAATNRPFDLDDAVIRRLPRRIMIGLPNTENRVKILKKILENEAIDPSLSFEQLAAMTAGYSGSDLKNLCVAAAYRPIREFLKLEKELGKEKMAPLSSLRTVCFEDFKEAITQVGASISNDSASNVELVKWNEQYGEGGGRQNKLFGFSI